MLDVATILNTAIGCFIAIWLFYGINMVNDMFLAEKNDIPKEYATLSSMEKVVCLVLLLVTGPFQIWDEWEHNKKK